MRRIENCPKFVCRNNDLLALLEFSMSLTFGLVTMSYAPDFQRCQLLAETVQEWVKPPFQHYIVVDRCDYHLFKSLANSRTQIVTVESLVPWWIKREPIWRKMWLSLKTPPLRNWILQQIVKIAIVRQMTEDVGIFIDSDVAFVRSFELARLVDGGQVRLFRNITHNEIQRNMHRKWHEAAAQLLGVNGIDPNVPDYIGNLITWKRDNVQLMCDRLEQQSGKSWVEALGNTWHLSEYVLYGLFVEQILGERSGHYIDSHNFCHDYWLPEQLNDRALQHWIETVDPEQVAVMISAKAGIAVDRYAPMLKVAYA
jgi:hypothetical protein